jgi:hypothetical protein
MVGKPYRKGLVIGVGFSNSRLVMVAYSIRLSFSLLLAYSFCLSSILLERVTLRRLKEVEHVFYLK